MNNLKWFELALIYFIATIAFGQALQVPEKMTFAGMSLTIDEKAREEIQKQVDFLTRSEKYFNIKVQRARAYFPIIEKIFAEERLPDDFKYLVIQESSLIADAVSPSQAVGFWQFKDFTAKEMGLRIDHKVDERMNIVNSSYAAAQYLKKCNYYFNNWIYALQSYNEGSGAVLRKLSGEPSGAKETEITTDTYWYVKTFLAHKIAFQNVVNEISDSPVALIEVENKSISEIANEVRVEENKLLELNKWLKTTHVPNDKKYAFLIPEGATQFVTNDAIAENRKEESALLRENKLAEKIEDQKLETYSQIEINGLPAIRALDGDSYSDLAEKGRISLSNFLKFNEINISYPIQVGCIYFFKKKKKRGTHKVYTIKKDDDLWVLSQQFGMQLKFLLKYNRLQNNSDVPEGTILLLRSMIHK